jgi:hypothetical protein
MAGKGGTRVTDYNRHVSALVEWDFEPDIFREAVVDFI